MTQYILQTINNIVHLYNIKYSQHFWAFRGRLTIDVRVRSNFLCTHTYVLLPLSLSFFVPPPLFLSLSPSPSPSLSLPVCLFYFSFYVHTCMSDLIGSDALYDHRYKYAYVYTQHTGKKQFKKQHNFIVYLYVLPLFFFFFIILIFPQFP